MRSLRLLVGSVVILVLAILAVVSLHYTFEYTEHLRGTVGYAERLFLFFICLVWLLSYIAMCLFAGLVAVWIFED